MSRSDIIDGFLAASGWNGARRIMLAGDASFRKYERVFLNGRQAVVMDAPPDKEDIRPFIRIAGHLAEFGLSSPLIIASDIENGLLLLEDLGDDLFARILEKRPESEGELYLSAADVLIKLYKNPENVNYNGIVPFDIEKMLQQVSLLTEWFIPLVSGNQCDGSLKTEYIEAWRGALAKAPDIGRVTVLYDFHAENLIWLPERKKSARTGLLDFQDAMLGSPAYDMVSFLEDARRDIAAETVERTIGYYLDNTGINRNDFISAYHLMGAQRNCRIVGTFARLCVRDGKPRYLSFMPRVWRHIENDLSHPLLADVKNWMDKVIKPEWRGDLKVAA